MKTVAIYRHDPPGPKDPSDEKIVDLLNRTLQDEFESLPLVVATSRQLLNFLTTNAEESTPINVFLVHGNLPYAFWGAWWDFKALRKEIGKSAPRLLALCKTKRWKICELIDIYLRLQDLEPSPRQRRRRQDLEPPPAMWP